jgi:hypothetical protein
VLPVVEPHADDVPRLEGSEELLDLDHAAGVAERPEEVTLEKRHAAIVVLAAEVLDPTGQESDDLHVRCLLRMPREVEPIGDRLSTGRPEHRARRMLYTRRPSLNLSPASLHEDPSCIAFSSPA